MLNFTEMEAIIGKLAGTIKFFPSDVNARLGIIEAVGEMANDLEQVRWLVRMLPKRYEEWPGAYEVRALFCSRSKPRDGCEVYSAVYPDGIPGERDSERYALPSAAPQLEAGAPVSADPELAQVVAEILPLKTMPVIGSKPEETQLLPGETDLTGLIRLVDIQHRAEEAFDPLANVKPVSDDEIERLKALQNSRRVESPVSA